MRTELEAALLEDRDDVRRWAVYADWLEAAGDPHGALASLMLRREASPSRVLSEAVTAEAGLIAALTPESLKTLGTRGFPRLVPVFRRGFIRSAGAEQASDFEALIQHPSCAFLDRAILELVDGETCGEWLALVKGPLPWRSLELTVGGDEEPLALGPWLARLPYLEELTVVAESGQVEFAAAPRLRRVRLHSARPENLSSLLRAALPALTELELLAPEDGDWLLDPLATALEPGWSRFSEVLLEGTATESTLRLCRRTPGPKRVVVRAPGALTEPFVVPLQRELETSFVVLRGELTAERAQTLTHFAQLAGVSRLVAHVGALEGLTLLRLHGVGEAPLVPRVALQQWVKKDRTLDGVALTISASNDAASAWSYGPHVARVEETPSKRNVLPLSRRDDAHHSREQLAREVLDALLGFDPGLDVLAALLRALDGGAPRALIGAPPARGERLPLFTDHEAQARDEEALDDYYDEDSQDALDARDEDDDPHADDWDAWEEPDPWGAAPENVPDYGPVVAAPAAEVMEDDPEDDLDPPLYDAFTADEDEVWTEGPVDLPEHHAHLPGDPIPTEAPEPPQGSIDPGLAACQRCHQPADLARCEGCREELCRGCAGARVLGAWEDGRAFHCPECTPGAEGKHVVPSPRG